jgi:hypothetical protein
MKTPTIISGRFYLFINLNLSSKIDNLVSYTIMYGNFFECK